MRPGPAFICDGTARALVTRLTRPGLTPLSLEIARSGELPACRPQGMPGSFWPARFCGAQVFGESHIAVVT